MEEQRPDPEKLLKRVQEEERQQQRGKLKIYLGAAPGVGKTYTMLQDAHAKRSQGLDVIVGVVESHGRQEIESLLNGLEILPRQEIDYRGKKLFEFDLDAALKRNPALILVDEMAHTNVGGLRHAKRWQDIKEMLDRGIDVYTTLNIQHVDSLNDNISQIIHSRVQETVPDSMIEMADTIELVDLPPEDLLKRLQEGKVYLPQQAELAKDNFFQKGNLTALRELALRVTAERVGAQVLLYRQGKDIKHIWPTKEKLLICVGPDEESSKLIRAGKRMAASLQAEWTAVYVETPRLASKEQRNKAIQNLRAAERLGAETRILSGFDIVKEIMSFARDQNITRILIGKRIQSRWRDFLYGTLADEVLRNSGEIEIDIINAGIDDVSKAYKPAVIKNANRSWPVYAVIIGIFTIATLFIQPLFRLIGKDYQYFIALVMTLFVALIISYLVIRIRRQSEMARHIEHSTASLHTLSRQLASARGIDKLLEIAVRFISELFDSAVLALLPINNHLEIRAGHGAESALSEKEQGVAQWVYDLGQVAGLGTDTLPFSEAIYVPLLGAQQTIGVLRIRPFRGENLFTPEQMHLLEACANQIALALEVDWLHEQSKSTELQTETDRARSKLLQSVAHDLRAPLVAATGAASTLTEMSGELDKQEIKKLSEDIYLELEQLSRLINNLLQITYLEAESINLQKKPSSLSEMIKSVVKSSEKKLGKRLMSIEIPQELPDIDFDPMLIEEVLMNLIDNAVKFTPSGTSITISARIKENKVLVSVEDHGPGIMMDEVNKLFEKFYRGRKITTTRGLGLGLAICRGIVKAHGGDVWAENREGGGAAFRFTLPLA